jgi:trehalose 2-sulfotransferase
MPEFASIILCATPRSGSTMLCDLLGDAGLGRPNSFFRLESIGHWAERWGVPLEAGTDSAAFKRQYLAAMLREGRGAAGVFGLRLMWASLPDAVGRIASVQGEGLSDLQTLERALGPVLFIHLRRVDTVAQAVSRLRAEQGGLWHRDADGSDRERVTAAETVHYDGERIAAFRAELDGDEAGWSDFFATNGIEPVRLTYEGLTADPVAAIGTVLEAMGLPRDRAGAVRVRTARLADEESRAWVERFRREHGVA